MEHQVKFENFSFLPCASPQAPAAVLDRVMVWPFLHSTHISVPILPEVGARKKFWIGLISNGSCPECEFTTIGGNLILVPPEERLERLSCCHWTHDCTSALLQLWYNSWVDGSLVSAYQTQRETKNQIKQTWTSINLFRLLNIWLWFVLHGNSGHAAAQALI